MGTIHAIAFSLLGTVMGFTPALMPASFATTGIGGYNSSELWLEIMGLVQGVLGSFYLIRNEALPFIRCALALRFPSTRPAELPTTATILRPVEVGYMGSLRSRGPRVAA